MYVSYASYAYIYIAVLYWVLKMLAGDKKVSVYLICVVCSDFAERKDLFWTASQTCSLHRRTLAKPVENYRLTTLQAM